MALTDDIQGRSNLTFGPHGPERQGPSELMKRKWMTSKGQVVNACPFGCPTEKLDQNGYCGHLVGFTNSSPEECREGRGLMELMVRKRGRRVVQVRREREEFEHEDGTKDYEEGPPILEPVRKSDVLVRITSSSRVYRREAGQAEAAIRKADGKAADGKVAGK